MLLLFLTLLKSDNQFKQNQSLNSIFLDAFYSFPLPTLSPESKAGTDIASCCLSGSLRRRTKSRDRVIVNVMQKFRTIYGSSTKHVARKCAYRLVLYLYYVRRDKIILDLQSSI